MLTDRVEDDVVRLAVLGEVFLRVVDHLVRSERSHELEVLGVAYRGDVRAEGPGQLYSRGADGSRRAVDEDSAPLAKISLFQTRQCVERAVAYWRRLLEAHAGGHLRASRAHRRREVRGVGPEFESSRAEDPVADRGLGHCGAGRFDLSGKFGAKDPLSRPAEAGDQAAEQRDGHAGPAVGFTGRGSDT